MVEIDIKQHIGKGSFELDFKATINTNDFVCVFGPSGAGKTTLLRLISGIDKPTSGLIKSDKLTWFNADQNMNISPAKRKIGYVPQVNALFANMTVKQNLEFALLKNQTNDIINDLIDILDLNDILNKKIDCISGGEKQRVSIAQALVQKPNILLLDEPFSAIDAVMTKKLRAYLLKIYKALDLTIIFVSHQIADVFTLANHVIKLEQGKIIEQGSPAEVFTNGNTQGSLQNIGIVITLLDDNFVEVLVNNTKLKISNSANQSLKIGDEVVLESKVVHINLI